MPEPQRVGCHDGEGRGGLAAPGEDIEDYAGGVDAVTQCLAAGCLDRRQPVAEHSGEDLDHLAIAVIGAGELAPNAVQARRQDPILERRAIPQRTPNGEIDTFFFLSSFETRTWPQAGCSIASRSCMTKVASWPSRRSVARSRS